MRVSGLCRGRRREANIWLHAARRRFGPLCTYGIPRLFNATRLHYAAGVAYAGICDGAATCALWHRINVIIFRQSRNEILFPPFSFFLSFSFSFPFLLRASARSFKTIALCSAHRFLNEYRLNLRVTKIANKGAQFVNSILMGNRAILSRRFDRTRTE